MKTSYDKICIIAGKGNYPLLLAESARRQGIKHIDAIGFRHETSQKIVHLADHVYWIHVGQLERMLHIMQENGIHHAVMAGQITPIHLFNAWKDPHMQALLRRLRARNAETIFGAIGDELNLHGVELLPAHLFMEAHLATTGPLTKIGPTPEQQQDIALGVHLAKTSSGLDIGQTVVVKEGTVLAVEAFEGTDAAILRAGKLGGAGAVVVKVAKRGHDMRFDIPVIGHTTLKSLTKAKAAVLAMESGRTLLLDKPAVLQEANRLELCLIGVAAKDR